MKPQQASFLSGIPGEANAGDVVITPDFVAKAAIDFLQPSGRCLDPCKGDGAFLRYLPPDSEWCEIREGRDFFDWHKPVDWIISNPPYSIFTRWLLHSFEIANDIGYFLPISKVFGTIRLIRETWRWGGIRAILAMDAGKALGQNMGWPFGVVHYQREYRGPIHIHLWEHG